MEIQNLNAGFQAPEIAPPDVSVIPSSIPCWRCGAAMKLCAYDAFLIHYQCVDCEVILSELREDRPGRISVGDPLSVENIFGGMRV